MTCPLGDLGLIIAPLCHISTLSTQTQLSLFQGYSDHRDNLPGSPAPGSSLLLACMSRAPLTPLFKAGFFNLGTLGIWLGWGWGHRSIPHPPLHSYHRIMVPPSLLLTGATAVAPRACPASTLSPSTPAPDLSFNTDLYIIFSCPKLFMAP